jgi:hypothetical protein
MEKKYYYGNQISAYGIEKGYVDYATFSNAFNLVLNNDIISSTYDIGYWNQVSGEIDNSEEIEELGEKLDELVEQNEDNPSQILENEIKKIEEEIEELEDEEYEEQEVFQYYIVDRLGAQLLQDIDEIIYYNEELDMYVWGVTFYIDWSYVLTSIEIDW